MKNVLARIRQEQLALQGGTSQRWGSVEGHQIIQRARYRGEQAIYEDYFAERPRFPPHYFRRRYRMSRELFLRIHGAVVNFDSYFVQKRNAAEVLGLSSLQKTTAAMRMLAYGCSADHVDEYVRIGESTALECLKKFVKAIVVIFGDEYLRSPNSNDIARLLAKGSLNDINVLDRSFVLSDLAQGHTPPVNYEINGHQYTMGYYLGDGIYPPWSTFVKSISAPQGNKNKHFTATQESARKDVERAFGVLQARFAIVRGPARLWEQEVLDDIMTACVIVHNMIIEDERGNDDGEIDLDYDTLDETPTITILRDPSTLDKFIQFHIRIRDRATHSRLQLDLVEHLWQKHGGK